MNATREKKLQFIHSLGPGALEAAVLKMLRRKEAPWLTDEQIDQITEEAVHDERYRRQHNARERQRAFRRASLPFLAAAE